MMPVADIAVTLATFRDQLVAQGYAVASASVSDAITFINAQNDREAQSPAHVVSTGYPPSITQEG